MTTKPEGAKLHGGVWLPDTEDHFVEWMNSSRKGKRLVDGKLTYQYHKLEAACSEVKRPSCNCIDIGAHVGLWAMHLSKKFNHVWCFEPVSKFYEILPYNMPGSNYTLYAVALGDTSGGTVTIDVPRSMTGNAHIKNEVQCYRDGDPSKGCDSYENIPMRMLDEFEFSNIGLIKIDVEGYELPVLRGAKSTILKHKPIIVVEQKGNEKYYGGSKDEAYEWLRALGMKDIKVMSGDHIMGWS